MSKIIIKEKEILSRGWSLLQKVSYDYQLPDGSWQTQTREAYDRGDGVTVLLLNPQDKKIILTRQFRLPTYFNGNADGMLIETCAGKLEAGEDPFVCMKREIEEETGYRVPTLEKVFEAYMSPGSVTERIHFFIADYNPQMKKSAGGGKESEQENIEVLELELNEAMKMIKSGEICDGKTIMLLYYAALHSM